MTTRVSVNVYRPNEDQPVASFLAEDFDEKRSRNDRIFRGTDPRTGDILFVEVDERWECEACHEPIETHDLVEVFTSHPTTVTTYHRDCIEKRLASNA